MHSDLLNSVFRIRLLNSLLQNKKDSILENAVNRYLDSSFHGSYIDAIRDLYRYMSKYHRNEYIFKSQLLRKRLLGIHSTKTTSAFLEMPIGCSKADFVLINNDGIVFEIKTDLDNLSRLDSQIQEYYKAFKYVYVVCDLEHTDSLMSRYVDSPIGILAINKHLGFSSIKEAQSYPDCIEKKYLFSILRKNEYADIIKKLTGSIPEIPNVYFYRRCFEIFSEFQIDELYSEVQKMLRSRRLCLDEDVLQQVPEELKLLAYSKEIKANELHMFREGLAQKIIGDK